MQQLKIGPWSRDLFLCLFALTLTAAFCLPQGPPTGTPALQPTVALPTDPRALALLTAQSNGLTGPGIKPWQLKASYTLLDENGKPKEQGTFDEAWVSPTKVRRSISSAESTQTYYATESGTFRKGPEELAPALSMLVWEFTNPFFPEKAVAQMNFDLKMIDISGTQIPCLTVALSPAPLAASTKNEPSPQSGAVRVVPAGTYCVDKGIPAIRITSRPSDRPQFIHDNIQRFQGRYVAGDLRAVKDGKTILKAHLESLEIIADIDESSFVPPPDAIQISRRIAVSAAVSLGMLLKTVDPVYPVTAKSAGVQGVVVLQARISKTGDIEDLHVVSGPDVLQPAALGAVKQWKYRPYLLNGEPVEVLTTINVIFRL